MLKLHVRRMCGGAAPPWRYGLLPLRRVAGAVIVDNIGLALVYANHDEWRPQDRSTGSYEAWL